MTEDISILSMRKERASHQEEASEFCRCAAYVVPMPMFDGDLDAASLGSVENTIGPGTSTPLSLVASSAFGRVRRFRESRRRPTGRISPREADCLLWAAEGKTDWEISVILGISRSTVTKHMVSARDKLGAVNKTHAIATALRGKLLQ